MIQYNTIIQYSNTIVSYTIIQYSNTIKYNTIQYNTIQYNPDNTIQYIFPLTNMRSEIK